MNLLLALKNLNFTKQEAQIFVALSKEGSLTGYEAAKVSGISRSNAYATLQSLVDKGYAYAIEGNPVKYSAISKDDLINNSKREFERNMAIIENELATEKNAENPFITIEKEINILNKIENLISLTQHRLYFSANSHIILHFAPILSQLAKDGIKVVILSEKQVLNGQTIYYQSNTKDTLKIIIDTKEILVGTLFQALNTQNETLVKIIREAMINEIELIKQASKGLSQ